MILKMYLSLAIDYFVPYKNYIFFAIVNLVYHQSSSFFPQAVRPLNSSSSPKHKKYMTYFDLYELETSIMNIYKH